MARDQLAECSPAAFVAFDVLTAGGADVRDQPYAQRRALLAELLAGLSPVIGLMPMTTDRAGAGAWLAGQLPGIEGVVAKRRDQRYRPGVRGWQRIRIRETADAVVGGVLGLLERPHALILGRTDERGRLRMIGRTGALGAADRARVGRLLRAPGKASHPWPDTLGSGRFGQIPGARIAYTQVRPEVVVEFEHDTAAERGRFRHAARFVRVRLDVTAAELGPWTP